MTFEMYDALHAACETADADPDVRVLVLRGAGGKAFVSGTDISTFPTCATARPASPTSSASPGWSTGSRR